MTIMIYSINTDIYVLTKSFKHIYVVTNNLKSTSIYWYNFLSQMPVTILKIIKIRNGTFCCYHAVIRPKDANGMEYSVDPDQTAPYLTLLFLN